MADAGLVVYEWPCPRHVSNLGAGARLVLRSFSGRLVRVLAPAPLPDLTQFVAAGDWVALIRPAQVAGQPDQLQIIRVNTAKTVLRLNKQGLDLVAMGSSGRFALMTFPGAPRQRCQQEEFDALSVGQVGHPGMRALATRAWGLEAGESIDLAIAAEHVAYVRPTGRCLTDKQVVIAAPGAVPTPVPGLKSDLPLAFDGHIVATAHGKTVQLAATRG